MANDRTAPGGMGMLLLALLEGRDMYGYYAITRDGRAALAEQQAGWYAYADAVRGVLEGGNPCGA